MTSFNLTRSLLVVFVPGVVGVAPWALFLLHAVPEIASVYKSYPVFFQAVVFAMVIVAGTAFEDSGSRVEVAWDKGREAEYSVDANWWTYLARTIEHEPIGFRYLARHANTLAFELSMGFATVVFAIGVIALFFQAHVPAPAVWTPFILVLAAGVVWLFASTAYDTHELLCETRQELNCRMGGLLPKTETLSQATDRDASAAAETKRTAPSARGP